MKITKNNEDEVLRIMKQYDRPLTTTEIAKNSGVDEQFCLRTLYKLEKRGTVAQRRRDDVFDYHVPTYDNVHEIHEETYWRLVKNERKGLVTLALFRLVPGYKKPTVSEEFSNCLTEI